MPSAKARELRKVAARPGFILTRTTGSHEQWEHADGRRVTIPVHGAQEIGPPLLFQLLRQMRITLEQFRELC